MDRIRAHRFPPGYWEATWPSIQIQAVRYGLAGAALVGTAKAINFSYELSTFLVTGSAIPPAVAFLGGFGTGLGVALGGIFAHRAISLDALQLRGTAFALVQRNFTLERTLGGNLRIGDAMGFRVSGAGVTLREKRRMSDYLAPLAWQPAHGTLTFQVGGDLRTAVVSVEASKAWGRHVLSSVHVRVQDGTLDPQLRDLQLLGQPSGEPSAEDFLGDTSPQPVREPERTKVQLGNLW